MRLWCFKLSTSCLGVILHWVVCYMGMLSAFETAKLNLRLELKWAQLCSLLTVLLQPKVLHTTAESADTLNNVVMGRNHSAKELLTYIYLLLCFFFPVLQANPYFSTHLTTSCRFIDIWIHSFNLSEWVRGSERLSGHLSVELSVASPNIRTVHT